MGTKKYARARRGDTAVDPLNTEENAHPEPKDGVRRNYNLLQKPGKLWE